MVKANLSSQNHINKNHSIRIAEKIDNFLILCVYEQSQKNDLKSRGSINGTDGRISALPTYTDIDGSSTFIIWEKVYQENAHVFNSLRLVARNRLIRQIADNIVTFLLIRNQKFSPAFTSILNDQRLKNQAVQYIEDILKRETFLMKDEVWEDFCEWFQVHLTEWIVEEMTDTLGFEKLDSLEKQELNELFFQYISKNLSDNYDFLTKFTSIVNNYTINWVDKISETLNIENYSIDQIETLLSLNEHTPLLDIPSRNILTYHLTVNDSIFVMNNAPYQSVREALFKKSFAADGSYLWPTAHVSKGNVQGIIQIKPFKNDHYSFSKHHSIVKETHQDAEALSDLDADIFDALCTIFLSKAKHFEEIVEIEIDELLSIRGLLPKLGGEGRRGGYEEKQRRQILKSLSIIQKLWIALDKTIVYEKGKPAETKLNGRAFLFVDSSGKECFLTEGAKDKKIRYKVDQVFSRYLFGSGRQVALLPLKVLQYDPYRKTWEKRLGRYLSWRWRIQARKGDYLQPNKVSTLLEAIGAELNERTPSRTRDRLEKALDTLHEDGLIESWHYEKWEEPIADLKGWARVWENSMIIIKPPEFITEQYRTIRKTNEASNFKQVHKRKAGMDENPEIAGEKLREIREKFNLSLTHAAEELEISISYLSNIERGIKIPSNKIRRRLVNWLQKFD
ncbi:helix-turn-helix domain-containing protein [Cytobacillus sp. FSL H8-0458]|uniref:helix-turn-helix domain-containing protein n=1 Tax=Cytobacillus sp. FSL H8-0458 TaxID=2975346 RepID=UPI0030F9467A